MHHDTSAEQAGNHICHHCCMPGDELRSFVVDITTHNAVDVSPADDKPKDDSTLVDSFNIVAHPRYCIRDTRIDPEGTKERTSVLNMRLSRCKQHCKPGHSEERDENVAQSALACSVGNIPDNDGEYSRTCIRWYGQKLSLGRGVTHIFDDGRKEQREGVQWHICTHIDEHAKPHFPVRDGSPEVRHLELLVFSARLLVFLQTANDAGSVLFVQESSSIRKVMDEDEGEESEKDGSSSFDNEDPCPSRPATFSIQVVDRSSEKATK